MTTHVLTLPIPRPPMTLNEALSATWPAMRNARKQIRPLVAAAARKANLAGPIQRCQITVIWHAPDDRTRDNTSTAILEKAATDTLVELGVLPDDNRQVVTRTSFAVEVDRTNPRIEIHITEEPAA
jgi:Holliday junction resolvase RusA-like endonuclease